MDNDTILEIKELLKNIDYLEIKLNKLYLENNNRIINYKNNLNNLNELHHILCKKIY